ncbi:MAG TPA: hypothetical protein VJ672_16245 [Gemmatimonadaceae bacterium]|nr:hypothetical protein [Gemmatimonadaceae bacterium]
MAQLLGLHALPLAIASFRLGGDARCFAGGTHFLVRRALILGGAPIVLCRLASLFRVNTASFSREAT